MAEYPSGMIALCLSGGGYHAAIFQLGAVRWLNKMGWLPRLNMISSVSACSILAGRLGLPVSQGLATCAPNAREVPGTN